MDEARFGLKVWHRRRWCPWGARPPWPYEHRYAWLWVYVAIEPTTGSCFVLFLPRVDGACFAAFLHAFRRAVPEGTVALVLDGSGSHTSRQIGWPDGIAALPLPAYSPELNPAERLFERLRGALANQVFDDLATLEQALIQALQPFWDQPEALAQLTG
jgi:transposase